MTYFPTVGIVKAEFADVASKVLDAVTTWRANQQGDVFTARYSPTGSEPATYLGMGNRSAVYDEAQIALALLDGILPELPDGIEWGENGFPTEAQALEACSPANMSMEAGAGEHTSTPQERIMALHVKMNALLDNVGVVPITEDEDE